MRTLLIAMALMMTACSAPGAAPSAADAAADAGGALVGRELTPAARSACMRGGGRIERGGMVGAQQCVTPYADAGKRCTDGDQCLGDCRADSSSPLPPASGEPTGVLPDSPSHDATVGVCQADSDGFGCFTNIEDGRAEATLCID